MALPPLTVKCTWIFDCNGRGWTESLWYVGSSNDLNQHIAVAAAIGQKRLATLGREVRYYATRVSFETDSGANPLRGDSILQYNNNYNSTSQPTAELDTALLWVFRDLTGTRHKNMFMRGIWDVVESNGGLYVPLAAGAAGWTSAINQWVAQLQATVAGVKAGQIGWVNRTPTLICNLAGYVQNTNGTVTFTTQTPFTATGTFMVRLKGLNVQSKLNGQLLVRQLTNTTFVSVKPVAVFPYVSGGLVTFYDVFFSAAAAIAPQKIVERKAGAPLLEPRGRRRAIPRG